MSMEPIISGAPRACKQSPMAKNFYYYCYYFWSRSLKFNDVHRISDKLN